MHYPRRKIEYAEVQHISQKTKDGLSWSRYQELCQYGWLESNDVIGDPPRIAPYHIIDNITSSNADLVQ